MSNKPVSYSEPHRRLGQEIRKFLTGQDKVYLDLKHRLSDASDMISRVEKDRVRSSQSRSASSRTRSR